jgi:hypothetical protein
MNALQSYVPDVEVATAKIAQELGQLAELPMRCVWSDSRDGCSCSSRIPAAVVKAAWRREQEASGDHEGRFFHLIHDAGVWLAYGLENGHVRGVYCPAHNRQRAARSRVATCGAGEVVFELALAA